uniref:Uncharacterized protein n=1 Tax=Nelumbo nucifera TaxID=4432 RepID=A0A822Z772_NELNU|nr:TPA_asm: hypothetical protein HUJ06_013834 [Nelumbo nucifera]
MEHESKKIVISGLSFNNSTDLYAVLYVDDNRFHKSKIDLNNFNGSNLSLQFAVKGSDIRNSRARLVIKLRRRGTFLDKHIAEVRVDIKELYQHRGKSTPFSKQIEKSKWRFSRKQEVGREVNIKYGFEDTSGIKVLPTCYAVLARVVPCLVAGFFSCASAPAGGSLISHCFCFCPVYVNVSA